MFRSRRRGDLLPPERYRTLATIGAGGDAVVLRTLDTVLHRIVAVKVLKVAEGVPDQARRTFLREARLIGYLDHPGVVPIYDHFTQAEGAPCHAMKLLGGQTLGNRLGYRAGLRAQALSAAEAVTLFTRIAETLAFAHDRGVVHLDLKADNVMLGPYGEVLLLDWGNARLFDPSPYRRHLGGEAHDEDVALLVDEPPDLLSGTPHFMSPEQTERPRSTLGPRSDIFSAGVLLFLMLTGEVPFQGGDLPALFRAIRQDPVPALRTLNPEVPERLAAISTGLLAKAEADRPANLHLVLEQLAAYRDAGQAFPKRHLEAGEVLFREGDAGDAAYVVVTGRVAVLKTGPGGEQTLAELGPGEILGEIAILTGQPRTATVRALVPSTLRAMQRDEVQRELEKVPPWLGAMVATLGARFIRLNDELLGLRGGGAGPVGGGRA